MNLDANRIAPHLYQGAHPAPRTPLRQLGFDVLVLCAYERQEPDSAYSGVKIVRAPMDDANYIPAEALPAARAVASAWRAGHRVLVTCNMGRNRSGLVVALALCILTGKPGRECLLHVRRHRQGALMNTTFSAFLASLPGRAQSDSEVRT